MANCLKIAQEEGERHTKLIAELNRSKEELTLETEEAKAKARECQEQVRNYSAETEKLFRNLQAKDNELRKAYAQAEQLAKDKAAL